MNLSFSQMLELITPRGGARPVLTQEQMQIIQSPDAPSLVIAGAGAGKTQTVILRILWQIANMGVDPESILALTFTHRAASELRRRLHLFLYGSSDLAIDGVFGRLEIDDSKKTLPLISTYNSFAAKIVAEWGMLCGYNPDLKLITPDISIQIIKDIIFENKDPDLFYGHQQDTFTLIDRVLKVSSQMQENLLSKDAVEHYMQQMFTHFNKLYEKGSLKGAKGSYKIIQNTQMLLPIIKIAHEFALRKKELGFIDYGDQIAFAINIIKQNPHILSAISCDYKCIILDEYQDTSASQAIFLSALFAGKNIMAVGDAKQSIYAFRGASESNMKSFAKDFSSTCDPYYLSVSFRNRANILGAANSIALKLDKDHKILDTPLDCTSQKNEKFDVEKSNLNNKTFADGFVDTFYARDFAHEVNCIVRWIASIQNNHNISRPADAGKGSKDTAHTGPYDKPSVAILVRDHKQKDMLLQELKRHNINIASASLDRPLDNPAVLDLHAFLCCVFFKNPGVYILRLLVGAHFEIGLADIKSLHAIAVAIKAKKEHLEIVELIKQGHTEPELALSDASLMDAVYFIAQHSAEEIYNFELEFQSSKKTIHTQNISKIAIERIKEFVKIISTIADFAHLEPLVIAKSTVHLLNLDLPSYTHPKSNNDAYLASYFRAINSWGTHFNNGSIEDCLHWIEARDAYADDIDEGLDEHERQANVQILTLHGSKGLEWDYVVLPFCCENKFPKYNKYRGWISELEIPYDLRLNSGQLPSFAWEQINCAKDLNRALAKPAQSFYQNLDSQGNTNHDSTEYSTFCAQKSFQEQRRLFYVGITRAKNGLLITCAQNYNTKAQFVPSSFIKDANIEISDTVQSCPDSQPKAQKESGNDSISTWPSSKNTNDYARNLHIINRCIRTIKRKKLLPSCQLNDFPLLAVAQAFADSTYDFGSDLHNTTKDTATKIDESI